MFQPHAIWIARSRTGAVGRAVGFRHYAGQNGVVAQRSISDREWRRSLVSRSDPVSVAVPRTGSVLTGEADVRSTPPQEALPADGQRELKPVSWPAIYLEMGKAKLSGLVTMTTAAGFALAVPVGVPVSLPMLAITCTGTGLAAMSASAFNQIMEVSNDSRMVRTSKRPLVAGKISPLHATIVAGSWGIGGVALLATHVNPLTGVLAAANIGLYTLVYTPMKQRSVWNTWVGAVVGAIPPVMGWTAVTGGIDGGALLLGALLFSWQMPHFLSLAYMMRKDYRAGGYKMMPQEVGTKELTRASAAMIRHCFYLQGLCMAAPYLGTCLGASYVGLVDPMFVLEATVLNGTFLYFAMAFHRAGGGSSAGQANSAARKTFLASLLYLPLLLGCMVFHRALPAPAEGEEGSKGCPFLDASKIVSQDKQGEQGDVLVAVEQTREA